MCFLCSFCIKIFKRYHKNIKFYNHMVLCYINTNQKSIQNV
ncbi:hypothetical protein CLOBOL_05335 [Enterocloster bolteae ATCC BAA-613]|uniref:Uncharacterized protein n=1 Tax=Enterocloster bolteae (strain ATCC BAA-613 / DSM 15670 / CCUG 46953 / JCM 12243 / WAL 16351) TaxID=411902 RepID=A8RZ63_ENTBW|nr:hypothetical protein CLOBOL_05335 [Enterocloster bolteae ATCC BAA-613]